MPNFPIGGSDINLMGNVKYLGGQIDSNINWNQHLKVICGKIPSALGFLSYTKKFMPNNTLLP